jgi:nucleoside-diphosphate-sugar epimerase
MEILATGVTGTIGKHLTKEVKSLKIDLLSQANIFSNLPISRNSHLLHLAGMVGPKKCDENPVKSHLINVVGTQKLASIFAKKSKGVFIFVSSGQVYKPGPPKSHEVSELQPTNQYGRHKLEAELQIKEIFHNFPDRLMILRVFSVLDWNTSEGSLGFTITNAVKYGHAIDIPNSDDIRDFMKPKGIAKVITSIIKEKPKGGTFNLCSGLGLSVEQAVRKLCLEKGKPYSNLKFLGGNSALPYLVGDNEKLLQHYPDLELSWSLT